MIPSTTNSIEGRKAVRYLGVVSRNAILDIDYETIRGQCQDVDGQDQRDSRRH